MNAIAEGEEEPSDENLPEEPSDDDADYNYYIQSAFMSKSYFNPPEVWIAPIADGELDDQSGSDEPYQTCFKPCPNCGSK